MKNFGCVSECSAERAADLLKAYFDYIESVDFIRMEDVFNSIVDLPARRFYVSPSRAAVVLSKMDVGDDISYMRKNKRDMFIEIHRRYKALLSAKPHMRPADIIRCVVEQPAPKFYISPISAKIIILKARKEWYKEKSKKLLRLL